MAILFRDAVFLEHKTGVHPESPARLEAVHRALDEWDGLAAWEVRAAQPVQLPQLERVHTPDYIAGIREFAESGGGRIESDTVLCDRSYDVALRAAGTTIAGVDAVLSGEHDTAVCLVRPPGHHALPAKAMGFCLFNNVAAAAAHALAVYGLSRVLIVDWDVHHGNGTQAIFYESPNVYFFSSHRWPFYPGTGDSNETGAGEGLGTTFNLPLAFGISRREFKQRFERMLTDASAKCRPELVLISAGFDAHAADPVGSLGLESEDFTDLTDLVADVARRHCGGRVVSVLEGGYNVEALAESVLCHLGALAPAE